MFDSKIYIQRRKRLKESIQSGLILFLGNEESPMNYPQNPYHFRQDSSFLYFFGLDSPLLAGVINVEEDKDIVFGDDVDIEDIIWMGFQPSLKDRALEAGVEETEPSNKVEEIVKVAIQQGKKVHFLPPYRSEVKLKIAQLLGLDPDTVKDNISKDLIKAVVEQRSIKIDEEIEEMERAQSIAYEMHTTAMRMAKPGVYEREIVGKMEGIVLSYGCNISFPTILTINGQILHNHYHGNMLEEGRLLVNDSGAESELHYASDITRTVPVGGKFTQKQKEIYEIVLHAQERAIQAIKPNIKYRDVHLQTAKIIASGLKDIGLMKGDAEEAVKAGAHALFFPHGLGHQIGLDVHDMEDIGEDHVGYDDKTKRSDQFGLAYLRMARELHPGFVMTAEPGIYFIPALIDKWKDEGKFTDFINYEQLEEYRDFGGIRIEDNILVTETGYRVLGKPIPKSVEEVEEITAK
ncbi:MAG: aminopeptidase P family protein [Candidatus Aminicenantes bacterium]|nr:MAG: aminopeptidase P family protein [Candidatus Aminicenantes bacterium]